MDTLDFKITFLGQSVLRYRVPLDVYNILNSIYESKYPQLPKANPQLIGKIEKENSLFFDGPPNKKMHSHNYLPDNVTQWFTKIFKHYLDWNNVKQYEMHLNSVWVNQMFEHEYNQVHIHQGTLFTGQFSNVDYQTDFKEKDFYVFPYDMRHCVYPFNGPGMRRTLAANMDVHYDPVKNRGAH